MQEKFFRGSIMNCNKGDLVRFSDERGLEEEGMVIGDGHRMSVYVEDRPMRVIDAISYPVMTSREIKKYIYDYQIKEIVSNKEERNA